MRFVKLLFCLVQPILCLECPTFLSDTSIEELNAKYFANSVDVLHFSNVPKEVPICQMVRKAMQERKETLGGISLDGTASTVLGEQILLAIRLELENGGYSNLKQIWLPRNGILDVSSVEHILKNSSLTLLDLKGNKIVDIDAIAKGLKENSTLEILSLSKNPIKVVTAIGEALKENKSLKTLYLVENGIKDLSSISEALKTNRTLEELILWGNGIVDVNALGEALKINKGLKVLNLESNKINVGHLQCGLKVNKFLDTLAVTQDGKFVNLVGSFDTLSNCYMASEKAPGIFFSLLFMHLQ